MSQNPAVHETRMPMQASAITDVGQCREFAARQVHAHRTVQPSRGVHRDQAARAGKYRLHQIERRAAMFTQQLNMGARDAETGAGIVYPGATQLPASGGAFLMKREDMELVNACHALDQREERGNDPHLARTIDAAGNEHCNLHGAA